MSELKCCPFCSARLENIEKHRMLYQHPINDCFFSELVVKQDEVDKWNIRKPMDNIVEKLEELKNEDVCMETSCTDCKEKYKNNSKKDCYEPIQKLVLDKAINIVKQEINKEK